MLPAQPVDATPSAINPFPERRTAPGLDDRRDSVSLEYLQTTFRSAVREMGLSNHVPETLDFHTYVGPLSSDEVEYLVPQLRSRPAHSVPRGVEPACKPSWELPTDHIRAQTFDSDKVGDNNRDLARRHSPARLADPNEVSTRAVHRNDDEFCMARLDGWFGDGRAELRVSFNTGCNLFEERSLTDRDPQSC
jgi:hypothetical protein